MDARTRCVRLIRGALLLLALGLGYALWVTVTGLAVPCLFHAVTGFRCPGCGVTGLCLALLRLDFSAAWAANPVLLLMLPLLAVLLLRLAVRYVRSGSAAPRLPETVLFWGMAAVLLVWGAIRNLPH